MCIALTKKHVQCKNKKPLLCNIHLRMFEIGTLEYVSINDVYLKLSLCSNVSIIDLNLLLNNSIDIEYMYEYFRNKSFNINNKADISKNANYILNKNKKYTCNCCYDDEISYSDVVFCSKKCESVLCKDCLKRSIEIKITDNILDLKCIDCDGEYNSKIVTSLLETNILEKFNELFEIQEVLKLSTIIDNFQNMSFL